MEHVVCEGEDFQAIGEGTNVTCISKQNREFVKNGEENTYVNARGIQEYCNTKTKEEIKNEENESLQCMKEEVTIKFDDLLRDEIVEG